MSCPKTTNSKVKNAIFVFFMTNKIYVLKMSVVLIVVQKQNTIIQNFVVIRLSKEVKKTLCFLPGKKICEKSPLFKNMSCPKTTNSKVKNAIFVFFMTNKIYVCIKNVGCSKTKQLS
jgi:hypothetical protein